MRKLAICVITIALSLSALSQNYRPASDSTTLPNSQLRAALELIERGKQCSSVLRLTEARNELLQNKVNIKDSVISSVISQLNFVEQIKETYLRDVKIYEVETNGLRLENTALKKSITKEKRNARLGRLATVGAVAVVAMLIVTK